MFASIHEDNLWNIVQMAPLGPQQQKEKSVSITREEWDLKLDKFISLLNSNRDTATSLLDAIGGERFANDSILKLLSRLSRVNRHWNSVVKKWQKIRKSQVHQLNFYGQIPPGETKTFHFEFLNPETSSSPSPMVFARGRMKQGTDQFHLFFCFVMSDPIFSCLGPMGFHTSEKNVTLFQFNTITLTGMTLEDMELFAKGRNLVESITTTWKFEKDQFHVKFDRITMQDRFGGDVEMDETSRNWFTVD